MKNIAAIIVKELNTYFVSPIAYIAIIIFIAFSGFLFTNTFFRVIQNQYPATDAVIYAVMNMGFTLLLFAPAITMRLFAEEKRSGTIELLMTLPVKDTEVVLGKFFASMVLLLIVLGLTWLFPLLVIIHGNPDIGPIFSGYLGLILFGAASLSVGILISSTTRNQIVSILVTLVILLLLWVVGLFYRTGIIGDILSYISFLENLEGFSRGVVSVKHIVYYLSFIGICLFLTVKSVESAKWR